MRPTFPCQIRIRAYTSSTASSAPVQRAIRAAYYRGGTSRAVIIHPQDLPSDQQTWPSIFRQLMGSGDPYGRQLDGMGAGISSLSKICLVESYAPENRLRSRTIDMEQAEMGTAGKRVWKDPREAHVDYTFVGLGIENDEVDVAGNCGNMSSAIGPYAYNARLLPRQMYEKANGEVTVKIRNTNTGKFIDSTFTVVRRQASVTGDYAIDGVAGTAAKIKLDFRHPYGSKTGKVLPTGKKVDMICGYRVTCIDGANPAVFIRADDIGVDGTILPNDFNKLPQKLELLEKIRASAAVAMGIADDEAQVPRTIPKIGIVSMSSTHPVLSGSILKTSQVDLVVRFISDTQPHRAIPLTAALTTAVAARIPGTIVEQLLAPDPVVDDAITIGHASGRIQVNANMDPKNSTIPLTATAYRTAKRLFEGNIFWVPKVEPIEGRIGASRKRPSLGMAFVMASRGPHHASLPETMVKQHDERLYLGRQCGPAIREDHSGVLVNGLPQHTADVEIPAVNFKLSDQPSVELPPDTFSPGPGSRSESSELIPAARAHYPDHGTVSVQALRPPSRDPAHSQAQETLPFLNLPESRTSSSWYSQDMNDLQGRFMHSRERFGQARVLVDHKQQAGPHAYPANLYGHNSSVPVPNSHRHTLKQEIDSVQKEMKALRMRLNTLKHTHDQLYTSLSSFEAVIEGASAEVAEDRDPNAPVAEANGRSLFAEDLSWRKAPSKNEKNDTGNEVGKHLAGQIMQATKKNSSWRLSKKRNLLHADERGPGRRW